ncbi:MAG: hypothetical protein AABY79_13295 [Nitrospirota bacterium]|jgi:uncharacterized Zn finger protein
MNKLLIKTGYRQGMRKGKVFYMKCPKCGGLMTYETFTNQENLAWHYDGWRCLYCGDVVDEVILANQKREVVAKPSKNKDKAVRFKRHLKAA